MNDRNLTAKNVNTITSSNTYGNYVVSWNTPTSSYTTYSGNDIYCDINNLASNDSIINDSELNERVSKKIEEVLNEDVTIDIMKRYLLRFIEENIDNPEGLIKEILIERDVELNKCKEELNNYKKELDICRSDIYDLKLRLAQLSIQTTSTSTSTSSSPFLPPSDIIWG
jgi:hypothetical protein